MYTTPLSTLISSQSLNHHLYADDTQLYFSFYPPDLHSSISHLSPLQQISSWMTANLLTLNSSKTEFLLIGLKQQLAKIQNSPLSTTHSARNLGFTSRWTLVFLRPHNCTFQVLQLWHLSALLYPPIPRYQNSQHHCHLNCSLQT